MHAVSISLGSTSTIVSVAIISNASTTTESSAPIRVIANSAGHRVTPTIAAFAEGDEVLFGDDARALYARVPHVVVPYLFTFAAIANKRRHCGSEGCAGSGSLTDDEASASDGQAVNMLIKDVEMAAKLRYSGYCPLQHGGGEGDSLQSGFRRPRDEGDDDTMKERSFIPAEEMLVMFFDHIKRHTIDGACGLTATEEKPTESEDKSQSGIMLTVVVPRYLFPEAMAQQDHADTRKSVCGKGPKECGPGDGALHKLYSRRCSSLQWVKDAVRKSHLGSVTTHVSVIFSDEAVLFGMDALSCRPHPSHAMAGHHFLVPPTVAELPRPVPAWPSAHVLVVDWGALGVSLTSHHLEAGCLLTGERIRFLRTSQTALSDANEPGKRSYFASAPCGGGVAVDLALRDCLANNFIRAQHRVLGYQSLADLPARARRRLVMAVEEKKLALSRAAQVPVEIEALAEGVDLRDNATFSRTRVNASLRDEWGILGGFEKILCEYLRDTLGDGDSAIDVVVLCGGMLQIPFIAQWLRQLFSQYAASSGGDSMRFSRNLVIMEAGACTTMLAEGNESGPTGAGTVNAQTVENGGSVGAEELSCIGGCLHSYHIALVAMQRQEHCTDIRGGASKKGRAGKSTVAALSWQQRRKAEEARGMWCSLTRDLSESGEVAVDFSSAALLTLRQHVFLLSQSGEGELCAALSQSEGEGGTSLKLPCSVLTVLFAAHSLVPSRVVVPLSEGGQGSIVLYLFAGEFKDSESEETNGYLSVRPLTGKGIVLAAPEGGDNRKRYVVFTLRVPEFENGENAKDVGGERAGGEIGALGVSEGMSVQLVAQLVRAASEPRVVLSSGVQASVVLNL